MFRALSHLGWYLLLLRQSFTPQLRFRLYLERTLHEAIIIGVGSLPIIIIIGLFTGAVTAINTAYQLTTGLFPRSIIGTVVSVTGIMEMAPTITSLILAGRVGSSVASELGTMRVSEQIDALEVMGVNPPAYLIFPKVVASVLVFPALIIITAFLLHVGGLVAGAVTNEVNPGEFAEGARVWHEPYHITYMCIKSVVFGFLISSISSYHGFFVRGGALEVGLASTRAVVISCVAIILSDYVLAALLL